MKTCYPTAVTNSIVAYPITRDKKVSLLHTIIKHIHFVTILVGMCSVIGFPSSYLAQINTYNYSTSTGVSLETGAFTNLLSTFSDNDVSALTGIGFTFNYNGIDYTDFSVTSNGLLALGGIAVTDNNNVTSNLVGPYLLPYWDDNYTDIDGSIQYQLKGAIGSRKLIIEYNLSYIGNTGASDKKFQVWLMETSNIIQFVYGTGNNLNGGFSIGILSDGLNDFQSITTTTNTSSTITQDDNNTTWPGSGRAYIFTPTASLPVDFSNFEYTCEDNTIALNWETISEFNCDRYELEISRNGWEYQLEATINASGTTVLPTTYSLSIPKNKEIQYVRLRQVDIDGKSVIYGPFSLICDSKEVVIYPNPIQDQTYLICPKKDQEAIIEIYDFSGIFIYSTMHDFKESTMATLDFHTLNTGTYFIKLIALDESSIHLIVKE